MRNTRKKSSARVQLANDLEAVLLFDTERTRPEGTLLGRQASSLPQPYCNASSKPL
jgi:hypothetical protein